MAKKNNNCVTWDQVGDIIGVITLVICIALVGFTTYHIGHSDGISEGARLEKECAKDNKPGGNWNQHWSSRLDKCWP